MVGGGGSAGGSLPPGGGHHPDRLDMEAGPPGTLPLSVFGRNVVHGPACRLLQPIPGRPCGPDGQSLYSHAAQSLQPPCLAPARPPPGPDLSGLPFSPVAAGGQSPFSFSVLRRPGLSPARGEMSENLHAEHSSPTSQSHSCPVMREPFLIVL